MHYCKDDHFVSLWTVQDGVREAPQQGPPDARVDLGVREGKLADSLEDLLDLVEEVLSEAIALTIVPVPGGAEVFFRFRLNDQCVGHGRFRRRSLTSCQGEPEF